jgi:hypothetical protein
MDLVFTMIKCRLDNQYLDCTTGDMAFMACASPALILTREDRTINYDVLIIKERTYLLDDTNRPGHAVHARVCVGSLQAIPLIFTLDTFIGLSVSIHPHSTEGSPQSRGALKPLLKRRAFVAVQNYH